jgi:F1F0 ATPase subunit 2
MRDALVGPLLALLTGGVLGLVFFGGLWWTVRQAAAFRHPALAVLVSLLLRMALTLGGFLLVAGDKWQRWLLCLLGFIAARAATRLAVSRWGRTNLAAPRHDLAAAGDRHAA